MNGLDLLLIAGGKSPEHEISLISAWNILNKLKQSNLKLTFIAIDKEGQWFLQSIAQFLNQEPNAKTISITQKKQPILLQLGNQTNKFFLPKENKFLKKIDVVFPITHGPNGEDGSLQGVLKHLQLPFVGPGVLSSSICMDKDIAKRLFLQAKIPTSNFITLYKQETYPNFTTVKKELGLPLFIKPANMGSSVGINKVRNEEEYENAVEEAFQYDHKVIIEEFVEGIEVECAVLGNRNYRVSQPGTYVHKDDFFDFETKYMKSKEVVMQMPAEQLTTEQQKQVMNLSVKAYQSLSCEGMARVDTFFTKDGRFLVNEINTLPGFTQNSMYPLLMESAGVTYEDLIIELCKLAINRFSA